MSSHRRGRNSDHRRPNDPKPSGPRPIELGSTDKPSNESRSSGLRPKGARPMELQPTDQRNVDPQLTSSRLSGQRTMGPRAYDPRLTSDQPQPGASGVGGQAQIDTMRLDADLARIRLQIETTYPQKAEQEDQVERQKDWVSQMERDRRSSSDIRGAEEKLRLMEAALKMTVEKLDKARLEDEQVFMKRWRLQHDRR